MTDLSTLAASLSDAQREAIRILNDDACSIEEWGAMFTCDILTIEDKWRVCLTPVGVALRDHLERNG